MNCHICGSPKIHYGSRDLIEIDPISDECGVLWARWRVVPGSERYGCIEHPVKDWKVIRKGTEQHKRIIEQIGSSDEESEG